LSKELRSFIEKLRVEKIDKKLKFRAKMIFYFCETLRSANAAVVDVARVKKRFREHRPTDRKRNHIYEKRGPL